MEKSSYELFNKQVFKDEYQKITKPVIVADNLRTPENMGAVLRLAGNIGALKTLFISESGNNFRSYKINKTASGAAEKVDWKIIKLAQIEKEIPENYQMVALETSANAVNINHFQFSERTVFIVGNEVNGISNELLMKVHQKVFIPVPGVISSLNVTHALSVALFEWLRQMVIKL